MYRNNYKQYKLNHQNSFYSDVSNISDNFSSKKSALGKNSLDYDYFIRRIFSATYFRNNTKYLHKMVHEALNNNHIFSLNFVINKLKKASKANPKNSVIKKYIKKLSNLTTHQVKQNSKTTLTVHYEFMYATHAQIRPVNYKNVDDLLYSILRYLNPSYVPVKVQFPAPPKTKLVTVHVNGKPCYINMECD